LFSWLERPGARICGLLLGADRMDEATGCLGAELTEQSQVDTELEALRTSATLVRDLVLGNIDGPSTLAVYLSMVVESFEDRINTMAANGVP
jgi:hypothetical protein